MRTFHKLAVLFALLPSSASVALACTISQAAPPSAFNYQLPASATIFSPSPNATLNVVIQKALTYNAPSAIPSWAIHCFDGPACAGAVASWSTGLTLLSGVNAHAVSFIPDPSSPSNVAAFATAIAVEPSSLVLLGTGLLAPPLFYLVRRRRSIL